MYPFCFPFLPFFLPSSQGYFSVHSLSPEFTLCCKSKTLLLASQPSGIYCITACHHQHTETFRDYKLKNSLWYQSLGNFSRNLNSENLIDVSSPKNRPNKKLSILRKSMFGHPLMKMYPQNELFPPNKVSRIKHFPQVCSTEEDNRQWVVIIVSFFICHLLLFIYLVCGRSLH